jgi:hypothetical protein
MARPQNTTRRKMIDAYRLTDSLAGKAYCKVKRDIAARWVEQHLAHWCKDGEAIQLTETIAKTPFAESAIAHSECLANAGVAENDNRIAAARAKVAVWPSVGADPGYGKPTKAPLPTQPGGIKQISREELEKLSSGACPVVVDSGAYPVDHALRKNRMGVRLPNSEFVQQHFYDDDEQGSVPAAGLPVGYRETDGTELEG